MKPETITLAGGCFWCLEAVFDDLRGVISVESGYAGGGDVRPSYEQVCTGTTRFAEVVQVTFDPGELSYRELLDVFFAIHNPTTLNRQGADVGPQYRSVIFCHSPEQRATAEAVIAELTRAGAFAQPIVTELAPAAPFFEAEAYHQEYFRHNGRQPYCQIVIAPKVAKFRKQFAERVKA